MARPRGSPNKLPRALKEMILEALEAAGEGEGSVGYLKSQAAKNPAAFMSLLSRIIPLQVDGDFSGKFVVEWKSDASS